jgi:hypothetical protein
MATSKTVSDGKDLTRETNELQKQFQKPDLLKANAKTGKGAPNFPARYFPDSKIPNEIKAYEAAWKNFAKEPGSMFQKPEMPKKLVGYIQQRQEQETLMKFEEWLFKTFDFRDPNMVRYVNEMYPDYFDRRKAQLESDIELMKNLAIMRLHGGPQSREDLQLRFAIDSGLIDLKQLNRSIIWPEEKMGEEEHAIVKRGWWNPRSHVGQSSLHASGHALSPLGDWLGKGEGASIDFPKWRTPDNTFYAGANFMSPGAANNNNVNE